jgi:prepilin-type N-terminal cleavage/methylation domain-containing protein
LKQSGLTHEITSYLTGLPSEVPKGRRKGLTLTEVLTTIVIIVILTVVALPAINAFFDSMSSSGSAEVMINAALSNARAMAISRQRYVGVRFQLAYNNIAPNNPFAADQYMIFVINEPTLVKTTSTGTYTVPNGYCAVKGIKPIKLPPNIGVMVEGVADTAVANDIFDNTTFTIIFSPSGNLVIRPVVHVLREGTTDEVFNDPSVNPMFQDDYENESPYKSEQSQRSFIIYDKTEFKRAYEQGTPYSGYLQSVAPVYINPYTGTLINSK